MSKTCYSLFSGCGGSDTGMAMAGYIPSGGIEWHQPAADIYNANHSTPVTVANILEIEEIPSVDLLWASPVCTRFSLANPNRGEDELDIKVARHIAKLITQSRPRNAAFENVRAYRSSRSLAIIWAALENAGYLVDDRIYNAANYGVPSTRERLIVRATLEKRLGEVVQTHRSPRQFEQDYGQLSLFEPLPVWVSWWDAIEDRLSELPRSSLTENQKRAISNKLDCVPLLVNGDGNNYQSSYTTRTATMPTPTVTASIAKHPMGLLVDTTQARPPQGYTVLGDDLPAHTIAAVQGERAGTRSRILIERVGYYDNPNIYQSKIPAPTIRSSPSIDDKGSYRISHNILDNCDCYAADIICLADWQSFPRSYRWGNNRGEAGRAIGNAVPPLLAAAIAKSFT